MVNSSWTEEHIKNLWSNDSVVKVKLSSDRLIVLLICLLIGQVFPPCDTSHLSNIVRCEDGSVRILSLGQFRPEKDHVLQIKAMFELRQILSEEVRQTAL